MGLSLMRLDDAPAGVSKITPNTIVSNIPDGGVARGAYGRSAPGLTLRGCRAGLSGNAWTLRSGVLAVRHPSRLRHAAFGGFIGALTTFLLAIPIAFDSGRHVRNTAFAMVVGAVVCALWFATKKPDRGT